MNPKQKQAAIGRMNTDAIERIINNLAGPEALPATPERPLGGQVHLTGIGAVPVGWLKAELAARKEAAR